MNPLSLFTNSLFKSSMPQSTPATLLKSNPAQTVTANPAAVGPTLTTPKPTASTAAPTTQAKNTYINSISSQPAPIYNSPTTAPGLSGAQMDELARIRGSAGGSSTGEPAPTAPTYLDSYRDYLSQYAESLKPTDEVNKSRTQLAEIQNKIDTRNLETRRAAEAQLDAPGLTKGGAQQATTQLNRRSASELADLGVAQSGAARSLEALTGNQSAQSEYLKNLTDLSKPIQIGDSYIDPKTGQIVYSKPQSVSDQYGTGSIGEYNFAKSQGYEGSFTQYQDEDANRKKSIAAAGIANDSGLNSKQVTVFNQLVDKYNKSPLVAANDRASILRDISSALEKDPTNSSLQVSFIYGLIQALDTYQSAVKEGEIGLVSGTQGLADKLQNVPNKILKGSILSKDKINEYLGVANLLTSSIQNSATRKGQTFGTQANLAGVGPQFDEYISVNSAINGNSSVGGGETSGGNKYTVTKE